MKIYCSENENYQHDDFLSLFDNFDDDFIKTLSDRDITPTQEQLLHENDVI